MIALTTEIAIAAGAALVLAGICLGVWLTLALTPIPDACTAREPTP